MTYLFLSIAGLFLINVASPGASFFLTVTNSLNYGRSTGYKIVLGLVVADILLAIVCIFGISSLFSTHNDIVIFAGFIGGAYIAGLGLQMFSFANKTQIIKSNNSASEIKAYKVGFVTGVSNIQTLLFFTSLFASAGVVSWSKAIVSIAALLIASAVGRFGIVRVFTINNVCKFYLRYSLLIQRLSGSALFLFGLKISVISFLPYAVDLIVLFE